VLILKVQDADSAIGKIEKSMGYAGRTDNLERNFI